jgi:excisionase family DNA binding protein
MSELPALDRVYTIQELADYLQVSPYTVKQLIDSGRLVSLPNLSSGNKHRIRRVTHSSLLDFIKQTSEPKVRPTTLPLPSSSTRRLRLSK